MDVVEELRRDRESGASRLQAEYKAGLMALAMRFCNDAGDAEELVNATFAEVVENIDDYIEQSAFFAWMCQILVSKFSRSVRRKSNRMEVHPGDVSDLADDSAQAEIYRNADATLLREAIGRLPPDQREAIVLRYFADMPVAKIAKFLSIPSGTVRSRLHYARLALAMRLGEAARKPAAKTLAIAVALAGALAFAAIFRAGFSGASGDPGRPGDPEYSGVSGTSEVSGASAVSGSSGSSGAAGFSAFSGSPGATALFRETSSQNTEQPMKTANLISAAASLAMAAAPVAPAAETIAYWPFGNNGFHDVSGNGHDLSGAAVEDDGAACVSLDGTGGHLVTVEPLDLSGESAVTLECWVRATGKNSGYGLLFSSPSPAGTSLGSFVLYYTGRLQAQFGMGKSWQIDYTESQSAMDDGAWHHVAYVIDRSQTGENATRLYLDGVQQKNAGGQTGAVPVLPAQTLHVGGGSSYASGNNFFTGCIDDVRISRGALAPEQFLPYPTAGKAMRADSGALPVLAHWPFGGNGGKDVSGNGFDLEMVSVPTTSGTPSPSWSAYANACRTSEPLPLSAFSRTGLTVECFAKSSSGSSDYGMLVEAGENYSATPGAFRMCYDGGFKTASAYFLPAANKTAGAATTEAAFGALNDGRWRHFALVYDPSRTGAGVVRFYVDGVAAASSTADAQGAFALADSAIHLMRRGAGSSRTMPFYGSLDDVRITAAALAPEDFLASRTAGSTVALWRFDRETLEDVSGGGHDLVGVGGAGFGDGATLDPAWAASGTGIVLDGVSQYLKTAVPVDLSGTKAATVELDFNNANPGNGGYQFMFGTAAPASESAGLVIYRNGQTAIQAQLRNAAGTGWAYAYGSAMRSSGTDFHTVRHVIDASSGTQISAALVVDAQTPAAQSPKAALSGLSASAITLGHSDSYIPANYMKGKFLRAAVSDVALAPEDFVLDNLVDPEEKRVLAYWDFAGGSDKSGSGAPALEASGADRRKGALALDGSGFAATAAQIDLSGLTQATVECFALFGETPASGTLFAMGTGAGSFAVEADADAGTLSGSFVPYDHLAASCGGAAPLAPLAGKKEWHHVALVVDRTRPGADAVRFYVDYERATPAGRAWDAAARLLSATLVVGADGTRESGFFSGRVDDLRVSAGALDPAEFLQPDDRTETQDAFTLILR